VWVRFALSATSRRLPQGGRHVGDGLRPKGRALHTAARRVSCAASTTGCGCGGDGGDRRMNDDGLQVNGAARASVASSPAAPGPETRAVRVVESWSNPRPSLVGADIYRAPRPAARPRVSLRAAANSRPCSRGANGQASAAATALVPVTTGRPLVLSSNGGRPALRPRTTCRYSDSPTASRASVRSV
jgi:hypothetical protein